MAAYLKDVESNHVDLTAEKIMHDKLNGPVKTEVKIDLQKFTFSCERY